MKTTTFFLSLLLISILFPSCGKTSLLGVRGKGSNVSETRSLSNFSGVKCSIEADIDYTQDSIFLVEVSAQSNIQPVIETEVHEGKLTIKFKKIVTKNSPIRIIVHSPEIYSLELLGSGNINAMNAFNCTDLNLSVSGSGDINIPNLNSNNVRACITGSGNIRIEKGTVSTEEFIISGSGSIESGNVPSTNNNTTISGSGDVTTQVEKSLTLRISGSGNVQYKGAPNVDANISGSGKVIHIN